MRPLKKASIYEKLFFTALSIVCVYVLILFGSRSPDPRGFGTHESFAAPCYFRTVTGYPCPTCGITTSFALLCRGKLVQGLKAQPFGAFLFFLCLLIPCSTLILWIRGKSIYDRLQWRLPFLFFFTFAFFLAAWLFMLIRAHFA